METKIKAVRPHLLGKWKQLAQAVDRHSLRLCLIAAPLINWIVESLSRHSPFAGIVYLGEHPAPFLFNSILILVTLLFAALFKKKLFTILFAGSVWLWGGIVNGVLLTMRVTPFGFTDFRNIEQAIDIVDIYMKPWQIAVCVGGLLLFLAAMVRMYIRAPRMEIDYKRAGAALLAALLVMVLHGSWCIRTGRLSEEFFNLADSYKEYGFVYCFTKSVFDQGVDRPADYSDALIDDIVDEIEAEQAGNQPQQPEGSGTADLDQPNVIIVQLESFFDVNRMQGLTFSSQPLPYFTRLMQENPSGYFTVPSIGAGTVNTEFEVLTGMSLDYFGTGEYPYKTILRESVCPSLAYDLAEYGYSTHAIHNNNGTFYDRHKVYPNLGFDDFLSIEYMDNVTENILGWAKDSVLPEQILKCLDSSRGSDFVYTVAVQPHGRYPQERLEQSYPISVDGLATIEEQNQWEYYVSQMWETDKFVNDLLKALDQRGEPYVCIFYGDHLPSLDIADEELSAGNIYQTEYVICTNTGLQAQGGDIEAYQLSARVLDMIGLEGSVIPTLHQTSADEPTYQQELELLEYDVLYGDCSAFGGRLPYQPTEMHMGVDEIVIKSAVLRESGLYVYGANITNDSHIFVNGKPCGETQRPKPEVLCVPEAEVEPGDIITIVQMGTDREPLSQSNEYILN